MTDPACVNDFEPRAQQKMTAAAWAYVSGGAADEFTLRWNTEAFHRLRLKPEALVDISRLDTRVTLFGEQHALPILLAPVACHKLAHPDGELATVRGAGAAGVAMVLSSFSTTLLEDVAANAEVPLWFQLYTNRDRGFTRELVQRAQTAGYKAICLTVDSPVPGQRDREVRVDFRLPPLPNLQGVKEGEGGDVSSILDPTLTWQDVEWLPSFCKVPVLVKGVLNPADGDRAIRAGVAGVVVSNHGGRNLDTVPAAIDALPLVAERVAGRVPLLMDGGIRRGTDVLKALALGASAVLIGRPYIWGLAAQGEAGVAGVVNMLRRELEMAMALTGRTTIAAIDRSVIWP